MVLYEILVFIIFYDLNALEALERYRNLQFHIILYVIWVGVLFQTNEDNSNNLHHHHVLILFFLIILVIFLTTI